MLHGRGRNGWFKVKEVKVRTMSTNRGKMAEIHVYSNRKCVSGEDTQAPIKLEGHADDMLTLIEAIRETIMIRPPHEEIFVEEKHGKAARRG